MTSLPIRVLVVDDNRDSVDILVELLNLYGFAASAAHDGAEAIALARAIDPDVVLLDLEMPVLDGYAACRALRAEPASAQPFIVAHTARDDARTAAEIEAAGFDAHVVKPSSLAAIVAIVEAGAARRRPKAA